MAVHQAPLRASVDVRENKAMCLCVCGCMIEIFSSVPAPVCVSPRDSGPACGRDSHSPPPVSNCCGTMMTFPQAFLAAPQTGLCGGGEMRGLRITDCGQMSRYSLVRCGREGGEGDRTIFTAVKWD